MLARSVLLHRLGLVAIALIACRGGTGVPGRPLAPAGASDGRKPTDDGGGELARLSMGFRRDKADDLATTPPPPQETYDDTVGLGGDDYGGRAYAGWRPPAFSTMPNRAPKYNVGVGLPGVLEGTITWSGAAPAKVVTGACGSIDNPSLRVGENRGLAGVIVYIEKFTQGRVSIPSTVGRPATVGGALYKRGCALTPNVQLAVPAPIRLNLMNDAATAKLRVVGPAGAAPTSVALEPGARVGVSLADGVTRVEGEGTQVVPAWIVVLDTPYYAMTDDRGRFRIDELAAGTYEVTVWHAPVVGGDMKFGAPIVVKRTVVVGETKAARLDLSLK